MIIIELVHFDKKNSKDLLFNRNMNCKITFWYTQAHAERNGSEFQP